jgi:hypothetical protein
MDTPPTPHPTLPHPTHNFLAITGTPNCSPLIRETVAKKQILIFAVLIEIP